MRETVIYLSKTCSSGLQSHDPEARSMPNDQPSSYVFVACALSTLSAGPPPPWGLLAVSRHHPSSRECSLKPAVLLTPAAGG